MTTVDWPPHTNTPEGQWNTAPRMPCDRPPTKEEVWSWVTHLYGGTQSMDWCIEHAKKAWAWAYVHAVNFKRWDKQPDWLPGDPIIRNAIPHGPFPAGQEYLGPVETLWARAQKEKTP